MMLRYSFNLTKEADSIENAVRKVLEDGYRTVDLMSASAGEGFTQVGCKQMGDLLVERIVNL
jgi:3-isopropylmalate dehydrogenase